MKKKNAQLREFALSTSQALRDPVESYVTLKEDSALPVVKTNSVLFDALFALAVNEMKLNSVSEISDGSYNGGTPVPCQCFKTGAKWNYVWTRDLSYASDLGLAALDPERVMNSLQFKLSDFRAPLKAGLNARIPDGRQIIQDTGTGGSWPISTDRTSWALGAEQLLWSLSEEKAESFAPIAYESLRNTIESDRQAAFDKKEGLYGGEQSFLDWREQTYAQWIRKDIAPIGMSKSLSTNATHYVALTLAARLATKYGDKGASQKYQGWADDLKRAINDVFWMEDQKMYASLTNTDNSPVARFDMLGIALVTLTGIAPEERAAASIAHYPNGPFGMPVYFPQQPDVPVYHNRAIWPFVTAYGLKAAAKVGNVAVFDQAMASLMRGSALNLSNMENLEWLSGQPTLLDMDNPELTGPVINSQRQLWSVGGYLGMVMETVFGYHLSEQGIDIKPFITAEAHRIMGTDPAKAEESVGRQMMLSGLDYHGRKITIAIELPEYTKGATGFYGVNSVSLNGRNVSGIIDNSMLADSNTIVVHMGALKEGRNDSRRISKVAPLDVKNTQVFAPVEPTIQAVKPVAQGLSITLEDNHNPDTGVVYSIYRDSQQVATNRDISQPWLDTAAKPGEAHCYSAQATYTVGLTH